MKFSEFGQKFTSDAGITTLMEDLGNALASGSDMIMMGGGNPAHIPQIQDRFKQRLESILSSQSDFQRLIGIYDPPQGNIDCTRAVASLLKNELGWAVTERNIALTNGSQAAFFMLFNLLAGEFKGQARKQIQLPLAPEYIGYADSGLQHDFFKANRPSIEHIDESTFKYHIDFDELELDESIGAICVSRPTNPTGNVLTDEEVTKLDALARQADIPLIIDGAYGTPFPELIFTEATPFWNPSTVVCLSLSKFGLPAARTGIVVADEYLVKALAGMNAILNLATGSFGSIMAQDMIASGEIIQLSRDVVNPYYRDKALRAEALLRAELKGLPVKLHKVEGAMFLWLWCPGCPVNSQTLYERLKAKGVLVVPGHHFFPGLDSPEGQAWSHRHECLRITYSQDEELVARGLKMIAEEVRSAYSA